MAGSYFLSKSVWQKDANGWKMMQMLASEIHCSIMNWLKFGAWDRNRTGTAFSSRGILSPLCLPISPPGRGAICLHVEANYFYGAHYTVRCLISRENSDIVVGNRWWICAQRQWHLAGHPDFSHWYVPCHPGCWLVLWVCCLWWDERFFLPDRSPHPL